MKWFIILAWLVAAQFVHGAHVRTIRRKADDQRNIVADLEKPGSLKSCSVTSNEGKNFELYPEKSSDPTVTNISCTFEHWTGLRFYIRNPTVNLNGRWIVKSTFLDDKKEKIELIDEFDIQMKDIYERKNMIPEKKITVYEGNLATFQLPGLYPKLKSCIVENRDMGYDVLSEQYYDWKIQDPDVCGVRLPINQSSSGDWSLYAEVSDSESYYSSIKIEAKVSSDIQETLYFQIGEEESIVLSPKYGFTYCQFEDPSGKKFPVQEQSCSHKIPLVTKSHEGLWKIFYGVQGRINPLKANITVETYDHFSSNVTYAQGDYMKLLCRVQWKSFHSLNKVCRFTRPDNLTFNVSPGIGYKRYEYYGSGYQAADSGHPESYDCGLTIRSPIDEDFGAWRCTVQTGEKITGTILRTDDLSKIFDNQSIKSYSSKVYVQKGKSFALKCSAENVLNYCWMLSPNGTVYTVSKNGSSPSDLIYEGSGLEFGECGAVVEVADDTHLGEWTCRMGILNGVEVGAKVSVTVTDSLLIADENTIDISIEKPTILNCRILPGHDNMINYCRWIRPDGLGIFNNVDNKYVTEKTLSSCKLTIQEFNVQFDVGSWTCAAGIRGKDMMEATTRIQINDSHITWSYLLLLSMAIAVLIVTAIILFIIIVRQRRNKRLDEKCILYN